MRKEKSEDPAPACSTSIAHPVGGADKSNKEKIMSRMALNDHKAGMEGLDRESINKVILEASKGTANRS